MVDISYRAQKRIERPILALGVLGVNGRVSPQTCFSDGHSPASLEGEGQIHVPSKRHSLAAAKLHGEDDYALGNEGI